MNRIIWSCAVALTVICGAAATSAKEQGPPPAETGAARRIELADGGVSMDVPVDFTELSRDEIQLKFPKTQPPNHVYGNKRRTVTIAVTFSPASVTMQQLPEMKQALEELMPKTLPGLEWVARDIVTINGRRWVYLAALTPAVDTTIRNDMLMTSLDGKALMLNFNATVDEYEQAQPHFDLTRRSLRVSR